MLAAILATQIASSSVSDLSLSSHPVETLVIASLFTAGPVFPLTFLEKFLTNIFSIDGLLDPQQHSCVPLIKSRD